MNWKLFVGQAINKADNLLLRSGIQFIQKNYPFRRNWIFDLKRIIPDAHLILDVGAYVGEVSLELNKWYPAATILAFEPVTGSYEKLKQSAEPYSNILPFNLALGDKNQTVVIPIYNSTTINTLKDADYDEAPISSQNVTVARLDSFFMEKNIDDSVDILKIDVEGYELEVLKGMGENLKNVKYIITEVGYQRTNTKTYFSDMDAFMERNNFELYNIYELSPLYNDRKKLHFSNNLYVNKSLS